MAFCAACGKEMPEAGTFCPSCGAAAGHVGYSQAPPPAGIPVASPFGQFADFGTRLLGWLIDFACFVVLAIPFVVLGVVVSPAFIYIFDLAGLGGAILFAIQVGKSGQSPGMRMMGIRCVHLQTGQPIGEGMGVVRALANIVNSLICYVGWLFPLWDSQKQTLGDKIMSTVVIKVPKLPFSIMPPG